MRSLISSMSAENRRYKALAHAAIAQLDDSELTRRVGSEDNSVATLVRHISGNLQSRFSDFRHTDGEKPWRNRDQEFEEHPTNRAELLAMWEAGWDTLFGALDSLTDEDLHSIVTIRGREWSIHEALHRSLAHTSYHVGQIVYVAKSFRGADWRTLSIPRGGSAAYNQNPHRETGEAQEAVLRSVEADDRA